jgi:hypothetical protein
MDRLHRQNCSAKTHIDIESGYDVARIGRRIPIDVLGHIGAHFGDGLSVVADDSVNPKPFFVLTGIFPRQSPRSSGASKIDGGG